MTLAYLINADKLTSSLCFFASIIISNNVIKVVSMRYFYSVTIVSLCSLLLSACITNGNYLTAINSWRGKNIKQLVNVWGYPNMVNLTLSHLMCCWWWIVLVCKGINLVCVDQKVLRC